MPTLRSRGLRPLTHAVLASLCFTLPACIEDVIVPPPADPLPDAAPDPVQPPYNDQSVFYDAWDFHQFVQPLFDAASCGTAGCHDPRTAILGFALHPYPERGSAEMWSNLNFVTHRVDLTDDSFVPENTVIFQRSTDNHAGTTISDPEALRSWFEDAAARARPQQVFDVAVFEQVIQPSLDAAGCNVAGCHSPGSLEPSLFLNPAPGSLEMHENFTRVTRYIDLYAPSYADSVFYIRATDNHGGRVLDAGGAAALESWINAAMEALYE